MLSSSAYSDSACMEMVAAAAAAAAVKGFRMHQSLKGQSELYRCGNRLTLTKSTAEDVQHMREHGMLM